MGFFRFIDDGIASVISRPAQRRVAGALVPVALALSAMGFVSIGAHIGRAEPARITSGELATSTHLRGAAVLPPTPMRPHATVAPPIDLPPPSAPALKGALPVGKGMWMYQPTAVEGGNPEAIVARAQATGLTHIFVRTGSSKTGFYAGEFLGRLLPVAHAHGIRVYGWDFPYFHDVADDINRAMAAIAFTTPDGHRIDGFSADIEFPSMGVKVTPANATAYGAGLRQAVGDGYPLIATVPRPSASAVKIYPYAQVVASFDAIAPMVYWLNREPVSDVVHAMLDLSKFGKPIIPIGQAYDGAADHGPPGVPGRAAIQAFMAAAEEHGATSVSFWSWQHASPEAWDAIRDAPQFVLHTMPETSLSAAQVRAYQYLLTSLGFGTPVDGVWSASVADAIAAYQRAAHLPVTGVIDAATKVLLLTPFKSPLLGH